MPDCPNAAPAGPDPGSGPPETLLEWRVWLARRDPGRAGAASAAALLTAVYAFYLFRSPLPALAAGMLLLGALAEFLFPVTYRLTAGGAEARSPLFWRRIAWSEVRRVYRAGSEIKLSPLAHASPREAFRGVLLRCQDNEQAVLDIVRRLRAPAPAPAVDRTPCRAD